MFILLILVLFWVVLDYRKTKRISAFSWFLLVIGGSLTFFGYFASTITVIEIIGVDMH